MTLLPLTALLTALAASDVPAVAPPASEAPAAAAPAAAANPAPDPATAPAAAPAPRGPVAYQPPVFEHRNTWDLGLEGGVGTVLPPWRVLGLARVRVGALWIRNSFYWSLGVTAEWTNAHLLTFGIQGELMHIENGLWVQVTPVMIDLTPRPGAMLAVGYSLFGVEAQLRDFGGTEGVRFSLFLKLRVPVRLLLKALGV